MSDKPTALIKAEKILTRRCKAYDELYKDGVPPQQRIANGEEILKADPNNYPVINGVNWLRAQEAKRWEELSRALSAYETAADNAGGDYQWDYEAETAEYLGVSDAQIDSVAEEHGDKRVDAMRDRVEQGVML